MAEVKQKTSSNPFVIRILCSWNTMVWAEDKSYFQYSQTMIAVLWYWEADLYKCCNWVVFR